MGAQLIVVAGPDKGRTFALNPGETLQVGRSQATPTRLSDPSVSRVHFEIELDAGLAVLHDCSSTGTMVNGQRVTQHTLLAGDVIHAGNTDLRFVAGDSEATTLRPLTMPKVASDSAGKEQLAALVGQTLSHYAVDEIIAKGATGIVFKARDTQNGQVVALKVLQPEFSRDDEEMQRFVRAMKTTLPLRHPNLVAMLGAGKTGPYCWMAMEHVDGESLTQVIQRIGVAGMLEVRYAYRVAVDVARALEYAHGQAIIHRNVTPRNLLIRHSDKLVKLGDVMLAKALEGTLAQQITRPGELLGEVAYMSPERTRGTTDVDGRADLYGLGATLYALLTGRPPFAADSMPELITRIRTAAPEKPKKYQISIPDMFQGTVLKLLAKRPEDRFQTASELLVDLERVGTFAGMSG
jgi:eukaryotic-like serine/threonine-protein kinase